MARFQSGNLDVRLDGIAAPINDDQAANKAYVDEHSTGTAFFREVVVAAAQNNMLTVPVITSGTDQIPTDALVYLNGALLDEDTHSLSNGNQSITFSTGYEVYTGDRISVVRGAGDGPDVGQFDLHDDVTTRLEDIASDDRFLVSDESTAGDPNRYSTLGDVTGAVERSLDSRYEYKIAHALSPVSSIPGGARSVSTQGTGNIQINANGTTAIWGTYPDSQDILNQQFRGDFATGRPTSWQGFLTEANYRNIYINFGAIPVNSQFIEFWTLGKTNGAPIYLLGQRDASNWAVWLYSPNHGNFSQQGFAFTNDRTRLIASMGDPGTNESLTFTINMDQNGGDEAIVNLANSGDLVWFDNDTWGTIGTAQLDDSSVTFAKIQDINTSTILGRSTGSTGLIEQLTPAQVRTILNVSDSADATTVYTGQTTAGPYTVPARVTNNTNSFYLNATGGWTIPTGTTYSNYTGQTASGGYLVPNRSTSTMTRFLREDGTWQVATGGHLDQLGDVLDGLAGGWFGADHSISDLSTVLPGAGIYRIIICGGGGGFDGDSANTGFIANGAGGAGMALFTFTWDGTTSCSVSLGAGGTNNNGAASTFTVDGTVRVTANGGSGGQIVISQPGSNTTHAGGSGGTAVLSSAHSSISNTTFRTGGRGGTIEIGANRPDGFALASGGGGCDWFGDGANGGDISYSTTQAGFDCATSGGSPLGHGASIDPVATQHAYASPAFPGRATNTADDARDIRVSGFDAFGPYFGSKAPSYCVAGAAGQGSSSQLPNPPAQYAFGGGGGACLSTALVPLTDPTRSQGGYGGGAGGVIRASASGTEIVRGGNGFFAYAKLGDA